MPDIGILGTAAVAQVILDLVAGDACHANNRKCFRETSDPIDRLEYLSAYRHPEAGDHFNAAMIVLCALPQGAYNGAVVALAKLQNPRSIPYDPGTLCRAWVNRQ